MQVSLAQGRKSVRLNSGVRALPEIMAFLRITSTPDGEAPEWVREQWVGLVIPLAEGYDGLTETETSGVLSSARTEIGQFLSSIFDRPQIELGYVVDSLIAIEILAKSSPKAADWWRVHSPDFVVTGAQFVFDKNCGHVVTETAP